jgi:hypothetical protein
MKLNDLEVTQPQKNSKARSFLESQHRVKMEKVNPHKANELLSKVHSLKESQFYTSKDFHKDPNYTKLAMLEQLLKEAADGALDDMDMAAPEAGGEGDNLEQAELILAVQDIIDDIMGMAEDLAEMQVQKLMPIVAKMKTAFSMEQAQAFEDTANQALSAALDTIKKTNDEMTSAVAVLQGKAPAMPASATDSADDLDLGTDSEEEPDANAGHDAASGPEDEPLGRGLKDEAI